MCFHFPWILAEPCSPWSLLTDASVEKKCAKQGAGMACTIRCASGYMFVDGENVPTRFTCQAGGVWSPSGVAPACVPIAQEPARYELNVAIAYSVSTPVGPDCLKVGCFRPVWQELLYIYLKSKIRTNLWVKVAQFPSDVSLSLWCNCCCITGWIRLPRGI